MESTACRSRRPKIPAFKGIGSSDLAFNLTAKEHATSLTDPDWMLVAVTDALGAARVRMVDSAELHRLAIEPTQYRVRE